MKVCGSVWSTSSAQIWVSTEAVRELATLSLRLGGLGLTNAVRIRGSAHWGSWQTVCP